MQLGERVGNETELLQTTGLTEAGLTGYTLERETSTGELLFRPESGGSLNKGEVKQLLQRLYEKTGKLYVAFYSSQTRYLLIRVQG